MRPRPTSTPPHSRRRATRGVALATLVVSASAIASTNAGAVSPRATAIPTFCRHLSISKIDAIVAAKVTLFESNVQKTVTACIFTGVPGNMSIETQLKMPRSQTHSLASAEAAAKALFPSSVKLTFAPVRAMGPVAFTWRAVNGAEIYGGLNVIKGSTGYFVEMGGALQLSKLEKLERVAFAA